jgi:glutaredoxin
MWQVKLYTRQDCCLCEEMKKVIQELGAEIPMEVEEIDVDSDPELVKAFGEEVPVLFINGRKAFKYRVTVEDLKKRLSRDPR